MTLILSGTNGVSDIDGDASTPAVRGTDANSGIFFGADTVGVSTGGSEKVSVGASAVVVNDGGADVDFRVEGDTDANLLFVDASTDRVGIGTGTPATELDVAGTVEVDRLNVYGASFSEIYFDGGQGSISYDNANDAQRFYTNSAERMRIDSSGNLLVNTTTANGTVTIRGTTSPTQPALYVRSYPTSNPTAYIYRDNTDAQYGLVVRHDGPLIGSGGTGYMIEFQDRNGGALGTITSSGTGAGSTAYNTSSDYRLKNTIAPMTGALAKVAALKPVTYKWNADNSDGQGFIAHELQEVFPEAVTGVKDEIESYTNDEGVVMERPRYQGIDTSFLVATLTAAIQEQQAIIESLTARVSSLEGN